MGRAICKSHEVSLLLDHCEYIQPFLYRLKNTSEAAREMLMRLPSPDSPLSGRMSEYQPEARLTVIDKRIISRRWTFKEACEIENPITEESTDNW